MMMMERGGTVYSRVFIYYYVYIGVRAGAGVLCSINTEPQREKKKTAILLKQKKGETHSE
jgi:hypothetical protein